MKIISTSQLVAGMILAEDVATQKMNKLLDKGTVLTNKDIAKLLFYSVPSVIIKDESVPEVPSIVPVTEGLTSSERLKQSKAFIEFKQDFEACASKFQQDIDDIVKNHAPLDVEKMLSPIYALLKKGKNTNEVFEILSNLRHYDDATYTHCINVALASNILAQWLRWDEHEIEIATLSGLFHDIGKLAIPDEIIRKPGPLDAEELKIMRTHPQKGYEVLKDLDISTHVKNAALMHHERCDGSGYPLAITAPQIDRYAKLVSIIDVYDAMTSARYYREALCPFIAISMFEDEGFKRYDAEMILCFLENIVNTYLLDTVRLNTGEVGEIVFINRTNLSKPTIKVGDDYIDLSKLNGVYIQELV